LRYEKLVSVTSGVCACQAPPAPSVDVSISAEDSLVS